MTKPMTVPAAEAKGLARLALFFLLAGCSSLYREAPPQVNLVDLRFTDITVFETSGVMVLRLSNENPDPQTIEGGVYNLFIDGTRIGQGLSDSRFEIPRLASETDEVPFRVNNLIFATRLKGIVDRGSFDYLIKAKVYVAGSLGRKTLRVEKSGHFDFERARSDALQAARGDGG